MGITSGAMEQKLGRDVFLALAAVAWADGSLDPTEADAIVRTALEEGLDLEEINSIEKATKERVDIGEIDISKMSKADRLFVYAVASWIVRIDGHVDEQEVEALYNLGVALKIPAKPRKHAAVIAKEIGDLEESDEPVFFNLPKLRRTLKKRLDEARKLREAKKSDDEDDEGDDA